MYELIVRSRWIAGLFAAVTLASVAAFVAEGGSADVVTSAAQTAAEVAAVPEPAAPSAEAGAVPAPDPATTEAADGFTDDEALIDPAGSDEEPGAVPTEAGPE